MFKSGFSFECGPKIFCCMGEACFNFDKTPLRTDSQTAATPTITVGLNSIKSG